MSLEPKNKGSYKGLEVGRRKGQGVEKLASPHFMPQEEEPHRVQQKPILAGTEHSSRAKNSLRGALALKPVAEGSKQG